MDNNKSSPMMMAMPSNADSLIAHSTDGETFQSLQSANQIGLSTSGTVTPKPMSTIGGPHQVTNMPATDVFGVQSMNLN